MALLQTIGRATRHQAGRAVLYADRVTPSMKRALAETDRKRDIHNRFDMHWGKCEVNMVIFMVNFLSSGKSGAVIRVIRAIRGR